MADEPLNDEQLKRLRETSGEMYDVEGEPLTVGEKLSLWSWIIGAVALSATALYAWFS